MKSKRQRREEAELRQSRFDKLTRKEKLDRCDSKPGNCKKERAKWAKD